MSQSHFSGADPTRATVALKACLGKVPTADVCKTATGTWYTYLAYCLDVEPRHDAHFGKQLCSLYLLNLGLSWPPENGCSLHVSVQEQEEMEATFIRKKMK